MPRILRNLKINEVSGVDRGAGRGVKIMLMKRDDDKALDWNAARGKDGVDEHQAIAALNAAIASIAADDACTDKVAKIDESIKQFNEYLTKENAAMTPEEIKKMVEDAVTAAVEKAKKPPPNVNDGDEDDTKKKKKAVHDSGNNPGADDNAQPNAGGSSNKREDTDVEKAVSGLKTENVELRKQIDSLLLIKRQDEFRSRAVDMGLKADDGETLRKAFDGDLEAQTALNKRVSEELKAARAQVKAGVIFGEFGKTGPDKAATAYQELEALAAQLRKTEPGLTQAQAFNKVYTDPANREVVAREKAESENRLAKIASVTGA